MGEFGPKPGGRNLVQQTFGRGAGKSPLDTAGRRSLIEQQSPVPRSTPAAPAAPARQPGAAVLTSGELGAWAGAGKAGKIFRNTTAERFVDAATRQAVQIETRWTMAEFEQFELQTNMALEVDRRIHLQLARGGVVIKSRARAFFHADQLPNDVHAALHAPARLVTHDGAIFVTDDRGLHLLRSFDHPKLEEPSVAALLAHEPMLGYETAPAQRLREAEQFVAVTVPVYDNNLALIEGLLRDAPHAAMELQRYLQIKLRYEDPPAEALATARHLIARIEELLQFSWTGYEGRDVMFQLGQMRAGFTQLLHEAEAAKPAEKHALDHVADLVAAIGKAGGGVVLAMKEVGLMTRDLGLWSLDQLAGAFGYELDWSAASTLGKAYEAGKSTSEIFTALIGGIIDAWTNAIEHAEHGDYSKLMDLGAELALDIAIEVTTAGAALPGVAAKRTGTAARAAERALVLTEDAVRALTRRASTLRERIRQALSRAPEAARAALFDAMDTATGWLTGLQVSVKLADTGAGALRIVDRAAISTVIQRSRGVRALETAKHAMTKLRGGPARAQGKSVIAALEKLAKASRMPDTIYAIARRIVEGEDKAKFVAALDKLLTGTARALDEEVVTGVLRHAADAVDPLAFLDHVEWVMERTGLSAEARRALVRRAVLSPSPLDLRWLRELTDLPDAMLEGMALDAATNWKSFMKVSKKPSDYFPSSLKKLLKDTDYRDAAVKLRGVAGELMFVVEGVELPGGLQIIARQVDAAGKVLDFALRDASGARALLEVKAWTARRWAKELAAASSNTPRSAFAHMVEQLKAAKSTGQRVYLGVSDAIGEHIELLRVELRQRALDAVVIVEFPETKLEGVASTLRKGLGFTAGVATVMADQVSEKASDD
jgi:hypothetical protein